MRKWFLVARYGAQEPPTCFDQLGLGCSLAVYKESSDQHQRPPAYKRREEAMLDEVLLYYKYVSLEGKQEQIRDWLQVYQAYPLHMFGRMDE